MTETETRIKKREISDVTNFVGVAIGGTIVGCAFPVSRIEDMAFISAGAGAVFPLVTKYLFGEDLFERYKQTPSTVAGMAVGLTIGTCIRNYFN